MSFFNIEWKMNIPNALSLVRIALLPVFAGIYLASDQNPQLIYWAFGVLILSGLTDSLDGIIARRFNQITDLGKLLDPVADKLTQVTVVLCLALRYSEVVWLLVICLIKELTQGLGGLFLLHRGVKINGARWYGKVSTFVFYGVMAIIVVWGEKIPSLVTIILVSLVAILMLFAFFQYIRVFLSIKKSMPGQEESAMLEEAENTANNVKPL